MKRSGVIEKDFQSIVLVAIADRVIEEVVCEVAIGAQVQAEKLYGIRRVIANNLIAKANDVYRAQCKVESGSLYRIKDETKMRDTLYAFMVHWMNADLRRDSVYSSDAKLEHH
jgi:hypothetical protein